MGGRTDGWTGGHRGSAASKNIRAKKKLLYEIADYTLHLSRCHSFESPSVSYLQISFPSPVSIDLMISTFLLIFLPFAFGFLLALWARIPKNADWSTGRFAHLFAHSLAPLTHSLACAPLRSLARSLRSLPRSWDSY